VKRLGVHAFLGAVPGDETRLQDRRSELGHRLYELRTGNNDLGSLSNTTLQWQAADCIASDDPEPSGDCRRNPHCCASTVCLLGVWITTRFPDDALDLVFAVGAQVFSETWPYMDRLYLYYSLARWVTARQIDGPRLARMAEQWGAGIAAP